MVKSMADKEIPKKIHYCWFGHGEKNVLIKKCIASWKKHLPDYKIIEWNEGNFDIHMNAYVEEAYNAKKWAFVTDYVRLYVLYHVGGIYMDTDVEVLKPLDVFLRNRAFSGFESHDSVPTGIMASIAHQEAIHGLLLDYDDLHFISLDGSYNMTTNVVLITKYFTMNGLKLDNKKQIINGFTLYPQVYFCPNTLGMIWGINSKKSYTIHHFDSSWKDNKGKRNFKYRIKHYLSGALRNIMGTDNYKRLKGI